MNPCKGCITFAICRSRELSTLLEECHLLNKYLTMDIENASRHMELNMDDTLVQMNAQTAIFSHKKGLIYTNCERQWEVERNFKDGTSV